MKRSILILSISLLAGAFLATASFAAPITFSDFASWEASAAWYMTEDFEGPGAPTLFTYSITGGSAYVQVDDGSPELGYNTTVGGETFLRVVPDWGRELNLLVDPIMAFSSFSAYFTGMEEYFGGVLSVLFDDGTAYEFTLPDPVYMGGGEVFFGFTDYGKIITDITIREYEGGAYLGDWWGMDDVSFGCSKPIPEPATLLLLGGGITAFAAARRRRRK